MIPRNYPLKVGDKVTFNIKELQNNGSQHFIDSEKPEGKVYTLLTVADNLDAVQFEYSSQKIVGYFSRTYLDLKKKPTIIIQED